MIKRSSSIFLGLFMAISVMFGSGFISVAAGSTTLYLSDSDPSVGDKFKLSVSGTESSTITVKFSSDKLTFEKCSAAGYTVDGNTIVFAGSSGDITFLAAEGGKADVIVSSDTLSGSSAAVNITGTSDSSGDSDSEKKDKKKKKKTENTTETEDVAETEPSTVASSQASENGDYNIAGVDYVISERYTEAEVPAGFSREVLEIHGKTYSEPVSDAVTLLYLKPASDTSGSGEFYVYDRSADTVSKMYLFGSMEDYVIMLEGDASAYPMLSPATLTIGDDNITAFKLTDSTNDFYYIYGIDESFTEDWYTYRESTGEVASADTYALFLTSKAESDSEEDESLSEEESGPSFLDKFSKDDLRNVFVALVIIAAIIIIFIINLRVFRRGEEDDDIWADPEPDDDEEDEDIAEDEKDEPQPAAKAPKPSQAKPHKAEAIEESEPDEEEEPIPAEEAILKNAMAGIMDESDTPEAPKPAPKAAVKNEAKAPVKSEPAPEEPKKVSAIDSLPKKKSGDDDDFTMIDLNNL